MDIFSIANVNGVFCDAAVLTSEGVLAFASLWGRDTAIQGLLGNLTLGVDEGGFRNLLLRKTDSNQSLPTRFEDPGLWIPNDDDYDKITGRVTRAQQVHGTLAHMFLFQKQLKMSNGAGRCATVIDHKQGGDVDERLVWETIKQLSIIPLSDQWREAVTHHLKSIDAIKPLQALGVRAWEVDLGSADQDEFGQWISQALKARTLSIPFAA